MLTPLVLQSYHRGGMPHILACGSGSIGHLAPLVAISRALRTITPHAIIAFACGMRPEESEYLRAEHVSWHALPQPQRSWSFPHTFLRSYRAAIHLLQTFQPDIILSRGGTISVPICLAASRKHLPIILHESDAVMGLATRCTAWWARSVTTGFPLESYPSIFRSRLMVTGNPVRPEMTKGSREEGLRITQFSGKRPIVLIIGGSQGAQFFNNLLQQILDPVLSFADVIHIIGKGKPGATARAGYWSSAFAYDQLPHLYAIATVALSRAGAGVMSELTANGIPSIVVPLRGLAQDHQWYNASFFARQHACVLVGQECPAEQFVADIRRIVDHASVRADLTANMRVLHHPDASRHIAEIVLKAIA